MGIKVGPVTYDVVYSTDAPHLDGVVADGVIDADRAVITIDASLSRERRAVTIWHELIHAIEVDRSMVFTEREVDAIARGVVSILIDNPDWLSTLVPVSNSGLRHP